MILSSSRRKEGKKFDGKFCRSIVQTMTLDAATTAAATTAASATTTATHIFIFLNIEKVSFDNNAAIF